MKPDYFDQTERGYNFSAGPAMLPESILRETQETLLNWQHSGMSVMEIGHRTSLCQSLMDEAEQKLKSLLNIPNNYHVLFLGGAARTHFAQIPINFLQEKQAGAYLVSGTWSSMAFEEAKKLASANCVARYPDNYDASKVLYLHKNTKYFYYTPNETIEGIYLSLPKRTASVPVVADMTSCLLTEEIDIEQYGMIFAGAQKNIANAGLTIVIVRDDFLTQQASGTIPIMLNYQTHVTHHSLYATPPIFNCYIASKMFDWINQQGGIKELSKNNAQKSEKLYEYIDDSDFYHCDTPETVRSKVNVCFHIKQESLEVQFIHDAEKDGLLGLKGHRLVGGIRASIYNAMPMAGVERLIKFMHQFEKEYGA